MPSSSRRTSSRPSAAGNGPRCRCPAPTARGRPSRPPPRRSRRPDALDEPADPGERLLELRVRGRVAGPDVALAGRPEGATRDDGDVFLLEEAPRERLRVESGRGDLRKGVERAERLEGLQAHTVEAVDDQPATAIVLGPHALDLRLAVDEGDH